MTHEYQPMNMNAVPYMMTMGGQPFAKAYKNMVVQYCGGLTGLAGGGCAATAAAVTPQPFFEPALANSRGSCNGFNSCTAAVVKNEGVASKLQPHPHNLNNAQVWNMWSDLDNGPFNFPHSMMNTI